MADKRTPITLAVLSGSAAGKVLRTARPKITIGSAADCDLVIRDGELAAQHFTVHVVDRGWRVETPGAAQVVVVDRRWRHPDDDRGGALLYAGRCEFLIISGELDDRVIQRELGDRRGAPRSAPAVGRDVERVSGGTVRAPSLDLSALPPLEGADASPTIQLPPIRNPSEALDPIALASMPTLAGAPLPAVAAAMAAKVLATNVIEENATVHADGEDDVTLGQARSAMAGALRGQVRALTPLVPEVLAEPESKMAPRPSVGGRPSWGEASRAGGLDARRNAWGDAPGRTGMSAPPGPGPASPPPATASGPGANAYGGFGTSAPPQQGYGGYGAQGYGAPSHAPSSSSGFNGGPGLGASVPPGGFGGPSFAPGAGPSAAPSGNRLPVLYQGRELTLASLASRFGDHAFEVLRAPEGRYATSIRVFGTRLQDLARSYGYRAYMVTSAEPLTGKTTVAMNLAFALAEDPKRRVALIEANFRQPRIGQLLGLPENQGLLGVLEGRQQVTEAIAKFSDRNLVVFPSGGRHPHPAEVLAAPRFKTLLSELASTVDVALIDAPSVRPSADANLILPLVDAAMLVVLEDGTRGGWIDQAMGQLGRERVIGAVYNQIDRRSRGPLFAERKQRLKVGQDA
jgi:Mrp family chromosome partitioning ATPase